VFTLSFQSFLITAMEMIRQPQNLVITAASLVIAVNVTDAAITVFRQAGQRQLARLLAQRS